MPTRGAHGAGRGRPVDVPRARVALSTASVYPEGVAAAFELAARLGYDGVEVMVWTDPFTREAGALRTLSELHGIPVLSVHAPTLLVTQRVWGTDPWEKIDRSIDAGRRARGRHRGAAPAVPLAARVRPRLRRRGRGPARARPLRLAVENMYPWRGPRSRELEAYLPHWDPVPQPYDHVTLDLSHTSTSGSDAMEMVRRLGPTGWRTCTSPTASGRRATSTSCPGGAPSRAARCSRRWRPGYAGHVVVEVTTRRAGEAQRELDLAEALAFARLHLATSA